MKIEIPTNAKSWRHYAMNRGRVRNLITGQTGNLVEWMPGSYCKVFTGYGEWIGTYKPANFETWQKLDTVVESNEVPVGAAIAQAEGGEK